MEEKINKEWARRLLFGRTLSSWSLDQKGDYYYIEFAKPEKSKETLERAIGELLLELGIRDGMVKIDDLGWTARAGILKSTFERHIVPKYHEQTAKVHDFSSIDPIYLRRASDLLFKDGLSGWELQTYDGSYPCYERIIERPSDGRIIPPSINKAILRVLNDAGVEDPMTNFQDQTTRVLVSVPARQFDEHIATKLNQNDAGVLAVQGQGAVRRC